MKLLKFLILVTLIAAGGALGYGWHWSQQPVFTEGKPLPFEVKAGSSVRAVSRQIEQAGVPVPALWFEMLVRISGTGARLKAGAYELEAGKTPLQLMAKLVDGDFAYVSLPVIEGWTFAQMRKAVNAHPYIKHDTADWNEDKLMKEISPDYNRGEGLFYPDTYRFARGSSDLDIYKQAHQALLKKLNDAWESRSANLPYKNAYEALIMASIIEKETGKRSERPLIAAVFVNRLRSGMLLQTDPTVIYGLGDKYNGKIYKKDLLTDTPYNTYTRGGLPPGPIALPGLESLTAALHPASSDVLYFVARGDGSSQFSTNLTDHNRAVNKYQR